MADEIWQYFEERRAECRSLSISDQEIEFYEESGSSSLWGQVHGHVTLSDEPPAYLEVHEVVTIEAGTPHREEYAYYLIFDGVDIWGYERDPSHADEPVHCHGRDHVRYPADPISFKGAVELAWATTSEATEHGLSDLDPAKPDPA